MLSTEETLDIHVHTSELCKFKSEEHIINKRVCEECELWSCELRIAVASCGLRVASCELRVSSCQNKKMKISSKDNVI